MACKFTHFRVNMQAIVPPAPKFFVKTEMRNGRKAGRFGMKVFIVRI